VSAHIRERSMQRFLLTATLLALLAGCASQPTAERPGVCSAARLGHLVGQLPEPATLEKARRQANAERVRVVEPGMAVTPEYEARGLTRSAADRGRIKLMSCGEPRAGSGRPILLELQCHPPISGAATCWASRPTSAGACSLSTSGCCRTCRRSRSSCTGFS